MEIKAVNTFINFINRKHKDIELSDCGQCVDETLPYVGASPDKMLMFSCCEKDCVETKCLYSMNYTKPLHSNLEYLQLCDGKTVLKKSHKYHTQYMVANGC